MDMQKARGAVYNQPVLIMMIKVLSWESYKGTFKYKWTQKWKSPVFSL